jgi:Fe-S cluster assembly protein SufB
MKTDTPSVESLAQREYKYGFVTDIESDSVPPGLDEDVIRTILEKKGEPAFMLAWRLRRFATGRP